MFALLCPDEFKEQISFSKIYRNVNYIGSHAKGMNQKMFILILHIVCISTNISKVISLLTFTIILIKTFTKKICISAKIESVKHLHTVCLLTAEQGNNALVSPTFYQIAETHCLF